MKRIKITSSIAVAFFVTSNAVLATSLLPAIQWQKNFGGSSDDLCQAVTQTTDGGFLLLGESHSGLTGNKAVANNGSSDLWVVKLDGSGNKAWEKSYGGSSSEQAGSLQQTVEGGFILGGSSFSGISGNKTTAHIGRRDYWLVKLDPSGNKLWDRSYGGTNYDYLISLQQTLDGGYILGGYSDSAPGGTKTAVNFGSSDYWIIKVDDAGNKLWEQSFGGTNSEYLASVRQTSDGGYILGGRSFSGISGNKSSTNYGGSDYWVVKLNSSGTKLWEKSFGGSYSDGLTSMEQTSDGGYLLGGYSFSEISGNKTSPNRGWGYDYWVIKLDGSGNKLWEQTFGGSEDDILTSLQQTADGGYVLGGYSESGVSGNKSSPLRGDQDYWIIKIDGSGNKVWEKSYGSSGFDALYSIRETSGNGFILAGWSQGGVSGNKTSPHYGGADYWVIKLEPNEQPNDISLSNDFIYEKHPAGTPVGTLAGVDPNAGDSHTFSLVGGTGDSDNSSFSISGNTLRSGVPFDFATKNSYSIRVRATDDGGLFSEKQFAITVLYVEPIVLTANPVTQTVDVGENVTLSVGFTGSLPHFQWFKNGNAIPNATGSSLSYSPVQSINSGRYRVVVSNVANSVTSSNAWLFVTGAETNPPSLAILTPKSNERITNTLSFTLSGTAKDAKDGLGIAQVYYRLTGEPFKLADGTTNWSGPLTLLPGTNKVEVKAVDFGGNESKVVARTFFSVIPSQFTLNTNGFGEIISTASALGTPTNGAMLEVGRSYKIKAAPAANNLFSNWSGSASSPLVQYTFVMQSNMTLTANFVTNKFIAVSGDYNGLFHEETNVTHQSAGFINVKVKSNLTFSAKLVFDGDTVSTSGKFDLPGTVTKTVSRATKGKSDLTLSLDLGFGNASNLLAGTVSDGINWIAELKADRAVFSSGNPATAYAGQYTMLLPGFADATNGPPGYGYGAITVTSNGLVKLSGSASADGQTMAQSVPISANGQWPFYMPLYKSVHVYTNLLNASVITNKAHAVGSMLGWLTFTNAAPAGAVSWIKTFGTNAVYPNGFTNDSVVMGSRYEIPAAGTRAVDIVDGVLTLTNGNLSSAITLDVSVKTNNAMVITPTNQTVKLSLAAKSGLLSGTFKHPDNTNATTTIKGVVLQSQKIGGGYFMGTNQGGLMLLE